jgi:hypothetical protein
MSQQNRNDLKKQFKDGRRPSGSDFEDLVDSTLNLKDDGFSWTVKNGVQIQLVGNQSRHLSFFTAESKETPPDWSIACEPQSKDLTFIYSGDENASPLKVSSPPLAGIAADKGKSSDPASSLGSNSSGAVLTLAGDGTATVHGTLRSSARFGCSKLVDADGQWHDITGVLHGCHILEVVAGVGLPGENLGRYSLLYALAMNTFNPKRYFFNFFLNKRKIKCNHAWYLDRGDRMILRWAPKQDESDAHAYALQLKTLRSWDKKTQVSCSITELWLDDMAKGT